MFYVTILNFIKQIKEGHIFSEIYYFMGQKGVHRRYPGKEIVKFTSP